MRKSVLRGSCSTTHQKSATRGEHQERFRIPLGSTDQPLPRPLVDIAAIDHIGQVSCSFTVSDIFTDLADDSGRYERIRHDGTPLEMILAPRKFAEEIPTPYAAPLGSSAS